MYLRAVHAEFHIPLLRKFIKDNPLGILITGLKSPNFPFLQCTHMPWVLDVADEQSDTELGILRGHLARNNPHAKSLIEQVSDIDSSFPQLQHEVTVVFNGPVQSYVTPKLYVQTKPDTGKVVPTWNYSAVQVYGKATVFCNNHDQATASYLQKQISDLTQHAEENMMQYDGKNGNPTPWEVTDAPTPFIDLLKKNIIGIRVEVERLEGKWKMSQEMGTADREGVINGFNELANESASKMAATVAERGARKDEMQAANKG